MNSETLARMYDFTGKTVAVTGGTGIIGAALVRTLAGCGANVAVLDRNTAPGPALIESVGPVAGSRIEVIATDVLDTDSIARALDATLKRFGAVDALVNGAGGNHPKATSNKDVPFFDLPPEAIRWVFELNIMGTILPSQAFGRVMAKAQSGTILNVSSMNAFRPLTRIAAYSAAKAGVSNFTQWLAVYFAQEYSPAIRVNAVAPGFLLTDQNRFLLTDKDTGALTPRGQSILGHTPMGRFGVTDDLMGAVLWLLSPASAFVTGVVLPVDGGFSAFSGV